MIPVQWSSIIVMSDLVHYSGVFCAHCGHFRNLEHVQQFSPEGTCLPCSGMGIITSVLPNSFKRMGEQMRPYSNIFLGSPFFPSSSSLFLASSVSLLPSSPQFISNSPHTLGHLVFNVPNWQSYFLCRKFNLYFFPQVLFQEYGCSQVSCWAVGLFILSVLCLGDF